MKMNRLAALLLVPMLLLTLFACEKQEEIDPMEGFSLSGTKTGGTEVENVNLSAVSVKEDGEDAVLTLSFVSGSLISGGTEETELTALPAYSVSLTGAPKRLRVELSKLAYWDYQRDFALEHDWFYGCFLHREAGSEGAALYFELTSDVGFTVSEGEGSLTIRLRKTPEQSPNAVNYYAMAQVYEEYRGGYITHEYEISPVLCRNFTDVVLLSPAFSTQVEAEEFRRNAISLSSDILPEQWEIIALYGNELPEYSETMEHRQAYAELVARVNGEEIGLPVLIDDGLYLAAMPDGSLLYSKAIKSDDLNSEDTFEYEELWVRESDGTRHRLLHFEFSSIAQCSCSPDGRRLVVLETADEGSHLYVFDPDTRDLITELSGALFGDRISAFTWNELGSTIYAISGTNGLAVHQYDFNISEESDRHSTVDKNGVDEGSLGVYGGEVYFAESTLEDGSVIYSIQPEGGVRKRFTEGESFKISSEAGLMAISNSGTDTEGAGGKSEFLLLSMETGEKTLITEEFPVYDFFFSEDGTRVYYFENRLSGGEDESTQMGEETESAETEESEAEASEAETTESETAETETAEKEQDPYPYALYEYQIESGETRLVAELSSTAVSPGERANELYLPYYDTETMGALVRATYLFTVEE